MFKSKSVALGLSGLMLVAGHAAADQASSDIVVSVEAARVMTLDCTTPLGFGVTTLGTGRSQSSDITLNPADSSLSVTDGGTDAVTLGSGQAGQCELKGSNAAENTTVTVTMEDDGGLAITDFFLAGGAVYNLSAPTADAAVSVGSLQVTGNSVGADGTATLVVGGTLVVPATMTDDNLGAYSGTVTLAVDDGV